MAEYDPNTTLGGERRVFPETHWSCILQAQAKTQERREQALDSLATNYWKPVYYYVRAKRHLSNDEAKDITQAFFLWMYESGFLQKADPTRGRFRGFIKTSIENFLIREDRRERTLKRGGHLKVFSLPDEEVTWEPPDSKTMTPEQTLDDAWKSCLVSRALLQLTKEYGDVGKSDRAKLFLDYYRNEAGDIDHQGLARKYGVKPDDANNILREARNRFRRIIRELIEETVESPKDVDQELIELFGSAGS